MTAPLADVLERQWKARIENELTLTRMTVDQVESARQLNADAVIYPPACLGTLAERGLIAPPSSEVLRDAQYARQEVFDLQRHVEVRWGTSVVAFSLGSPQLTLMYRADLLEALGSKLPALWLELEQLACSLTRGQLGALAPPDDLPWSPLVQPSSPPWGAHVLFARAAAYATHPSQFSTLFDYTTMEPLIAGPPFERALRELVACCALDPDGGAASWTPESARLAVLSGRAAMALTWPSRATTDEAAAKVPDGARFGFAPLPGSATVYNFAEGDWTPRAENSWRVPCLGVAGRLGSVTRNARRPREVAGILALLSSREWSSDIAPHSAATTLFRRSHIRQPSAWTDPVLPEEASRQYAEMVEQVQSSPVYFFTVRIPGWRRYLAALDHAVAQARRRGHAGRSPGRSRRRLERDHPGARTRRPTRRLHPQPRPHPVGPAPSLSRLRTPSRCSVPTTRDGRVAELGAVQ